MKRKACASRGSEMLADYITASRNERKLNIDRYNCKSNGYIDTSEVWSFGRVQEKSGVCGCIYIYVCTCICIHL